MSWRVQKNANANKMELGQDGSQCAEVRRPFFLFLESISVLRLLDQTASWNLYPFSDQNPLKKGTLLANNAHIAYIGEYPPTPSPVYVKDETKGRESLIVFSELATLLPSFLRR